ncbi:S8 family serine peptidase [Nonomuraea maritima]|uniref:S8 family serine peptidase n=1 Tax=Nonomuraea maritima TaxID=683260 RepID=UPI00371321EE
MPLTTRPSPRRLLAAVLPAVLLTAGTSGTLVPLIAAPAEAQAVTVEPGAQPKIDPKLAEQMKSARGRIEAVVVLRTVQETPAIESRAEARAALTDSAEPTQDPVAALIAQRGDTVVNRFWLKNMLLVRATPATLGALAELDLVDRIIPNFTLTAPDPEKPEQVATPKAKAAASGTTWGLAKIGVDRVRDERGLTGKGVRVAVLDTGIDATHPDLAGKLATADASDPKHPGGWIEFDPSGMPVASEPHDSAFHGTHVAGTIAGGDASGTQIGVAPGVELMAGLVIPGGTGTLAQVIAGMEWAIAPYAADGTPVGKPADVVSMSLGAEGYADEFIEPVRNIIKAGAFPAFAAGNDCVEGESNSPGNVYESVGVGATDVNDDVADFSCGSNVQRTDWFNAPADWPDTYVVPDVSAPGVDVVSTIPGGEYGSLDGTSMATPHVSGTVALMLEARPDLTVEATEEILAGTSVSDDRYGPRPNRRIGQGRIDAYAAVAEASLQSGVHGTVLDKRGHKPLAGVKVSTENGRSTVTDAEGRFEVRLPAGTHALTLSRFGYKDLVRNVDVQDGELSDVRWDLDRTHWSTITGTVTYEPTGFAVPGATVSVVGVPDELTATTDGKGHYTIKDVPVGDREVSAHAAGVSRSKPMQVTVGNGKARADVVLPRRPQTERVSVGSDGHQGNHDSWWPKVSGDGSVVVYASFASNLVDDEDNNGELDIFATDLRTRTTERVSVPTGGGLADSFSLTPSVSHDGRYVGFSSGATNLVDGDTNGQTDAFVHDRQTGRTELLSVSSDGTQGDGMTGAPVLSGDGRYAVFISDSTNLVPGDTNGRTDVFLRDRQAGTTVRVSVSQDGAQLNGQGREPSISGDGRYVAFQSDASDVVPGDTNGVTDVFVLDRQTGSVKRVEAPRPDTDSTAPVLSADGNVVVFGNGLGLGELYTQNLTTGRTDMVSITRDGQGANALTYGPSLTADGGKVVFSSDSANLVEGDTNGRNDVFLRDIAAGTTTLLSRDPDGGAADDRSEIPSISADGRYVAYQTVANNLTEGDTNHRSDIYVYDLVAGPESLFTLSDLKVSADRSGRVDVRATVTNIGEQEGSYQAVLRVDGEEKQQRTVSLKPGRDAKLSFDVRGIAPGDHVIDLGTLTGTITIKH